jgi:hypothetical protein
VGTELAASAFAIKQPRCGATKRLVVTSRFTNDEERHEPL